MILNSIRLNYKRFRGNYGNEFIIACDDKKSWRKDIFPYYKAQRAKQKNRFDIDWNFFYDALNKIREEIKEHFPYRVIFVENCEADDIIGTLVHKKFGVVLNGLEEKCLILSKDKDFIQLQVFSNVDQYDPIKKEFVKSNNPVQTLREHIMRGDKGDSIPNFLSPDNAIVIGERQKSIMTKNVDEWVKKGIEQFEDEIIRKNYLRNENLIRLDKTPKDLQNKIIEVYENEKTKGDDKSKLFNYFIKKRLKDLHSDIGDF